MPNEGAKLPSPGLDNEPMRLIAKGAMERATVAPFNVYLTIAATSRTILGALSVHPIVPCCFAGNRLWKLAFCNCLLPVS